MELLTVASCQGIFRAIECGKWAPSDKAAMMSLLTTLIVVFENTVRC